MSEQKIARCKRCGSFMAFRESSGLLYIDSIAVCCQHPDYWEYIERIWAYGVSIEYQEEIFQEFESKLASNIVKRLNADSVSCKLEKL